MTNILSSIPGQISLPNYTAPIIPPDPGDPDYWADVVGMYAKIEGYQVNNPSHMPNPYQPNNVNHADSIFGELDRLQWKKGILLERPWGSIETSPGVFNWTTIDFVLDTVRGLTRATGQNKKVFLLFTTRHLASLTGLDLIPDDLLTQNMAINGGYYKNPTSFPPSATNPIVNAKKYDHLWCYDASDPNVGGVTQPRGYNFNYYKFTVGAGTNTLKTRFYAFLDAVAARYGDDPVFAGIITNEAATNVPFVAYESGNSRNANYAGRKEVAKYMKSIFPNRMVAECVNFDQAYYDEMTGPGASDGLVANKLAFTTANFHTGTNMNLENINPVLKGKVAVIMQMQGLDMRTMSGNRNYFNWPTNPNQILGSDGINYNDPPTAQWLYNRIKYFNANCVIVQRNFDTGTNPNQQNWPKWKTFMNASVHANDPLGGMDGTKPQFVV